MLKFLTTVLTDEIDEQPEHVVDGEQWGVHHLAVHAQSGVLRDHRQAVQHHGLIGPTRRTR